MLLSFFGGVAALVVAYAGTRAILAMAMKGAEVSPLAATPSLPVLGFALVVSLLTGIIFGIVPALISSRSNPVEALRGANRSTSDTSALPQKMLVILQAALSLVLLSTAGLLVTSLRHLEHQDFQFEPEGRLIVSTDLTSAGYQYTQLPGLYRQFDNTFSQLPGVESFAYATYGPLTDETWAGGVSVPGVTAPPDGDSAVYSSVSPGYFATLGTHVLQGRVVTEEDTATSTHVAVVNQTFAQRYFKGKPPIGQHFGPAPNMQDAFEIIGVVADTKYGTPTDPVSPMYFTPLSQATLYKDTAGTAVETAHHYAGNLIVHYRGSENTAAASIRHALLEINPDIPILRLQSYNDQLAKHFTQEELVVRLTTLFGILALILASIGLYGVTAYAVARRSSEIGIRMALGASRGGVLGMIIRTALTQAVLGLALGLPLCFVAARLLQHSLYQTSSFQPAVLLLVASLLILSALLAALIPARRAASIQPMRALRAE